MTEIKTKHPVYADLYGLTELLTPFQLFKFLQIKQCIPEDGTFEEYEDNLMDYIRDVSSDKFK